MQMLLLDTGIFSGWNSLFLKENYGYTQFEPGTPRIAICQNTIRPSIQIIKEEKIIFNVYDLEGVDDQHPHGKSVGKYFMVYWVDLEIKGIFSTSQTIAFHNILSLQL